MTRLACLLSLGALVLGCSSTVTSAASPEAGTECDPLAAPATKLATILAVGKDSAGTLYVADQGGVPTEPSIVRVFIPSHGSLVRQRVIGSGNIGSANGQDIETFESADGSTVARDLVITIVNGKATSMTLGAEGSGKENSEGMDGGAATSLTLVDPSLALGMPAIDLPAAPDYVADSSGGDAIVVTSPLDDDLGSSAVRLFYGAPGAMVERPIVSFEQSGSGYPRIAFNVGSQTYVMSIASVPSDGGLLYAPGPVTLTMGDGETVGFTLRTPTPTTLDGFAFTCPGD